jgi:hypothetical protein
MGGRLAVGCTDGCGVGWLLPDGCGVGATVGALVGATDGPTDGTTSVPEGRTIVGAGVVRGLGVACAIGGSVGWTGGWPHGTAGSGQSGFFAFGWSASMTAAPSASPIPSTTTKTRISRVGETLP